jgi:hypothetical protein
MRRLAEVLRAVLVPLGSGTRVLLLRLAGRFGWWWMIGGAAVSVYAAFRYRTWITWMVAAWCVAAWMHAPDEGEEADELDGEDPGEEPSDPHPDPDDILDLVRDLVGDDRGILLTALRAPLHAADTRAVRELLAGAGIRVRAGVRTAGGNGPGVHRDDLPAPCRPLDEPPVGGVAAGEAANANATNGVRVETREGMTIIYDPADSHRTHVLKKP